MTTRFNTARMRVLGDDTFTTVIADFLRDAEAGRASDAAGNPYSPAALRCLRRALVHVDAALGTSRLPGAEMDHALVEELGWRVIHETGVPPSRLASVVDALAGLVSYATWQRPAALPQWSRPAPRQPERSWERPARRHLQDPFPPDPLAEPMARPVSDTEPRTPTFSMLALGAQVGAWMERIIVIAFVLTAIGLALALA
jgi:hypothetical protein